MARQCDLSNRKSKKALTGNSVSHSNRRTKRRQEVNLQTQKFWNPETKKWEKYKVSSRMIRTIAKNGISKVLAKIRRSKKQTQR